MSQISRETSCKAIINYYLIKLIELKQSVGFPPSGGVPCVSAPLGGTVELSAQVEVDAQKRGEKRKWD